MDDAYHWSASDLYISDRVFINDVYPPCLDYGSLSFYGDDGYGPGGILMCRSYGFRFVYDGYLPYWVCGPHNGDHVMYVWDTLLNYPYRASGYLLCSNQFRPGYTPYHLHLGRVPQGGASPYDAVECRPLGDGV